MRTADVTAAYQAAVSLGAVDSYDDTIGGSLRAPFGAAPECVEAVAEYRRREIALHRETYGRARRAYYGDKP
jgi:hypothetical protein